MQHSETDEQVSFCEQLQNEEESSNGPQEAASKVFSEPAQSSHQHQSSASEETSRFQSIKAPNNLIKPLDLTRVVQQFAQGLLTPTLTDPGPFQGTEDQQQIQQIRHHATH